MKLVDKANMFITPFCPLGNAQLLPVHTADLNGPGAGVIESAKQVEQCCFARPGDANHCQFFSGIDGNMGIFKNR